MTIKNPSNPPPTVSSSPPPGCCRAPCSPSSSSSHPPDPGGVHPFPPTPQPPPSCASAPCRALTSRPCAPPGPGPAGDSQLFPHTHSLTHPKATEISSRLTRCLPYPPHPAQSPQAPFSSFIFAIFHTVLSPRPPFSPTGSVFHCKTPPCLAQKPPPQDPPSLFALHTSN